MISNKSKKSRQEKTESGATQMKENNPQQILFAENDLFNGAADDLTQSVSTTEQQIIFDNQDWQPTQTTEIKLSELEEKYIPAESKPNWTWRIIFSLSAVMLVAEAVDFFITGFAQSPLSTSIYAVIMSALALVAGSALFKELSGLKQFHRQQKVKKQTLAVLQGESDLDAKALCETLSKKLPGDLLSDIEEKKWQEVLQSHYSDAELMQLYNKLVLAKVDQKALDEVAKFSTEAVVLVALSPVAIIDMLIILWRNLRMLNKISGLYGLKLGYWSRIKLIKQVFINMAYAGASELIADFGTEMLGADMLGKLSARLAQGLGAGLLTARLGLRTIQTCRPLPFDENSPNLGHIRREILSQIKQLVKK